MAITAAPNLWDREMWLTKEFYKHEGYEDHKAQAEVLWRTIWKLQLTENSGSNSESIFEYRFYSNSTVLIQISALLAFLTPELQ